MSLIPLRLKLTYDAVIFITTNGERKRDNIVYTMELHWHENSISWAGVWRWLVRSGPEPRVIRRRSTSRSEKPSWAWCRRWRTGCMTGSGSKGRRWQGSRSRYWGRGGAEGAGTERACRGSAATRTWTEPPRDFRLCRWQSRSLVRICSCCSGLPAARGSPSSSYSWVGLGTWGAAVRSVVARVKTKTIEIIRGFTSLLSVCGAF